ncbi:MAG: hypothetical protein KKF44_05350 [Nanoarchaeota archaeon]|nr:hypothetical protein [Nanoarchaeota archaeon]
MKKAQGSEFLSVVLMVIVLVIILLFSRVKQSRDNIYDTQGLMTKGKNVFLTTSITKFPYITEKGISINELMGTYVCYDNTEPFYGPTIGTIDLIATIRKNLDSIFRKGQWKLEIGEKACITSDDFIGPPDTAPSKCTQFQNEEFISYDLVFPLPCSQEISTGKIILIT